MPSQIELNENTNESLASLLKRAEEKKNKRQYSEALGLFKEARKHTEKSALLRDLLEFIISRQALCTYKLESPDQKTALFKATEILSELKPSKSSDPEVLGLSGAISKRLFELTGEFTSLDEALDYYRKGFRLRQDYYNGINVVFMLYQKILLLQKKDEDWSDTKIEADYTNNTVLKNCLETEKSEKFPLKPDALWILLTIAESYHYKDKYQKVEEYESKAQKIATQKEETFALSSYKEQKNKIVEIKNELSDGNSNLQGTS